jgi:hypothetical protein
MVVHTEHPKDQHSFLLEEGVWEAEGRAYVPADGRESRISGRTTVRHPGEGRITNEGWMRVHTAPIAFEVWQRFEFRPSERPNTYTFVSQNDRVGELTGEIVFWGPHAILHYASAKGRFRGSEWMTRVGAREYTSTGKFIADGKAETIWSVRLTRVEDPS